MELKVPVAIIDNGDHSHEFHQYMVNRMAFSFHKYGPCRDKYPVGADAIASLKKRIDRYLETGNTEWLIDAANFCMIEFVYPSHPKAHFRSTDSDESPGLEWK